MTLGAAYRIFESLFTEVRGIGILRSSLLVSNAQVTPKITHLGDVLPRIREYAALVTWQEDAA